MEKMLSKRAKAVVIKICFAFTMLIKLQILVINKIYFNTSQGRAYIHGVGADNSDILFCLQLDGSLTAGGLLGDGLINQQSRVLQAPCQAPCQSASLFRPSQQMDKIIFKINLRIYLIMTIIAVHPVAVLVVSCIDS